MKYRLERKNPDGTRFTDYPEFEDPNKLYDVFYDEAHLQEFCTWIITFENYEPLEYIFSNNPGRKISWEQIREQIMSLGMRN